jgi:hypothetical protein
MKVARGGPGAIVISLEDPSARGRAVLEALTVVRKVPAFRQQEGKRWYGDEGEINAHVPPMWARIIPTARPKFLKRNTPIAQNEFVHRRRIPWT